MAGKATYYQRGEALDYMNSGSTIIEAGTVIPLVSRVGIAGDNIYPNTTGTIHVSGVFRFAKGSTNEIPMGTAVYFDNDAITEAAGGTEAGYAAETSPATATEILVKIG